MVLQHIDNFENGGKLMQTLHAFSEARNPSYDSS